MKPVWNNKARPRTKLYWSKVRFCSIKEVFDCVRLAKRLGEFDYVRLPNAIQINRTIEVRLSSITERSIGYVGTINALALYKASISLILTGFGILVSK